MHLPWQLLNKPAGLTVLGRQFYRWVLAAACILYAVYLASTLLGLEVPIMILSITGSGFATAILTYCFLCSGNQTRIVLGLYMLGSAFWMAGDIVWFATAMAGGDPQASMVCKHLYLYTNIFIFAASFLFILRQFQKWSLIQLLLDITVTFCLCFQTLYYIFLRTDSNWTRYLTMDGLISAISMVMDFLIFVGVFIWFFSVRLGSRKKSRFNGGAIGLLAFALVDLYYYVIYYRGIYLPDSPTDTFYIAALLLIALTVLSGVTSKRIQEEPQALKTNRSGIQWYILLAFPAVAFVMQGVTLSGVLLFALVIVLYIAASRQVYYSMQSREHLRREKELNTLLEQKISSQLKELTILANQDTVTTLFNRRYFLNILEQTLPELEQCETAALILIDLDRFKNINDNFGHDVGDSVLIEIAKRLTEWNRNGSVIARLGGDEFAILSWSSTNKREDLGIACGEIVDACSKPIVVNERTLYATLSIGVAMYPLDAQDGISLLKNADIAMYRAKDTGYNQIVFYDSLYDDSLAKKQKIELLLRQADMDRDFTLYYQPQFSIPDRKLIAAEALLRWHVEGDGFIPPGEFIPVAEEIDYIHRVGKWIKNRAICQVTEWNRQYGLNMRVGINLSPKELMREDFCTSFKNLISKHHADPAWIDAEITENVMLDSEKVMHVFQLFNSMGITISIDDFGSGYSSWGYLTRIPFDRIKIDRALVENLSYNNANSIQVVKAIISMAKAVGKKTIAEGVEKYEQLDILISLHCDQVQGYLLGRPVPADVFEERFIRKDTPDTMFIQDTR